MAIYKFPNLASQAKPNTQQQYYEGLQRPNPRGNMLGNHNLSAFGKPIANIGINNKDQRVMFDQNTGQFMLDGSPVTADDNRRWGSAGRDVTTFRNSGAPNLYADRFDPRYYERFFSGQDEAGDRYDYRLRPEYADRLGDRIQLGQLGVGGGGEVIDPSLVEFDDEFGLVTSAGNIKEPNGTFMNEGGGLMALLALGGAGAIGAAGGFGGLGAGTGSVTTPGLMEGVATGYTAPAMSATPNVMGATGTVGDLTAVGAGSGVGTGGYVAGATPPMDMLGGYMPGASGAIPVGNLTVTGSSALLPGNVAGPAVSVATPNLMQTMGGYTPPTMLPAPTAQIAGMPLWAQIGGNLAGMFANNYLAGRAQSGMNAAADRADPFGQANRQRAANLLWQLYQDPTSVQNTPGYQFALQQGQQGISRRGASTGYYRSPNLDYQLMEFNQGLASRTFNQERDALMQMAGVQFNPGTAGSLMAQGVTSGNNMRAAGATQGISAFGDVMNYLFGGGNG